MFIIVLIQMYCNPLTSSVSIVEKLSNFCPCWYLTKGSSLDFLPSDVLTLLLHDSDTARLCIFERVEISCFGGLFNHTFWSIESVLLPLLFLFWKVRSNWKRNKNLVCMTDISFFLLSNDGNDNDGIKLPQSWQPQSLRRITRDHHLWLWACLDLAYFFSASRLTVITLSPFQTSAG